MIHIRSFLGYALREPLVHFLAAALLLFALYDAVRGKLGRLIFVAGVLAALFFGCKALQRLRASRALPSTEETDPVIGTARPRLAVTYAVGVLATFWFVERVAGF